MTNDALTAAREQATFALIHAGREAARERKEIPRSKMGNRITLKHVITRSSTVRTARGMIDVPHFISKPDEAGFRHFTPVITEADELGPKEAQRRAALVTIETGERWTAELASKFRDAELSAEKAWQRVAETGRPIPQMELPDGHGLEMPL